MPPLVRSRSSNLRLLAPLLDMGFHRDRALLALERTGYQTTELALDFLLNPRNDPVVTGPPPEPSGEMKRSSEEDAVSKCAICLMDLKEEGGAAPVMSAVCRHLFHPHCLLSWLQVRIAEGNVAKIVCPTCPALLKAEDVARLVPPALLTKYNKFKLDSALAANPLARWCPQKGCETPIIGYSYPRLWHSLGKASFKTGLVGLGASALGFLAGHRTTQLYVTGGVCVASWLVTAAKKYGMSFFWRGAACSQCPRCRTAICFECLQTYHKDKSCGQTEHALLKSWAEGKDTCLCPSCNNMIEKKEGCNHMTCRCSHQFCWLCREAYSPTHFTQGAKGCKQFGGTVAAGMLKGSRSTLLRRLLFAFVCCVVALRLLVPAVRSTYFYFYPFTLPTCPVPSPFTNRCPAPPPSTPTLRFALKSGALFIICEFALFLYGNVWLRGTSRYFRPAKPPAILRYFIPFGIPCMYLCRWLFSFPSLVGSLLSCGGAFLIFLRVATVPALRASRTRLWRALLVASCLIGVNFFYWPLRLITWTLSTGLFFALGNLFTGGSGVLFLLATGMPSHLENLVNHHLGGLGIYLGVASNFCLFLCLHFLGLSNLAFRLGMFVSVVFSCATIIKLRVRPTAQPLRRRWKFLASSQLLLCGVAYGGLLFLRDTSETESLVSQIWTSIVTSGVWGYLSMPADIAAIAALPAIYNLAHD